MMLRLSLSILKGSASISTFTSYLSAGSVGTRHEYEQVKPQPYSKLPVSTTSPFSVEIVNFGLPGRPPFTIMLVQTSPAWPTSDMLSEAFPGPSRYPTATTGRYGSPNGSSTVWPSVTRTAG